MSSEFHLDAVREGVRNELLDLLPDGWDIKAGIATVTTLATPTLYLEYSRIEPLPDAPIGQARCTFALTLTPDLTDIEKGENWADPAVVDLVLALDSHLALSWSLAEKIVVAEKYLGWKVTVSVIANTAPKPDLEPADPEE